MEQENRIIGAVAEQEQLSTREIAKKGAKKANTFFFKLIKRTFDMFVGTLGTIALLPILLVVKIAYLLTGDTAPIMLKQERLAQNGETFKLYKIRSMITGKNGSLEAANLLEDLFKEHPEMEEEYKKTKKLKNDPRITKVGKVIRKTSIDEFPQFINVLKGDLSIIGNRPYLPTEKDDMSFYARDILSTKPGIISYWAINGRNNVDFCERLRLEQFYSKNQNLGLDTKIAFKSIAAVLKSEGAN